MLMGVGRANIQIVHGFAEYLERTFQPNQGEDTLDWEDVSQEEDDLPISCLILTEICTQDMESS